jgi:hypothetical protein
MNSGPIEDRPIEPEDMPIEPRFEISKNREQAKVDRMKAKWQPASSHPELTQKEREQAFDEHLEWVNSLPPR